jgi:predicted acyltransferase
MSSQSVVRNGDDLRNSTSRLQSLDALRGFDMFWIAGGDALATSFFGRFDSPAAIRIKSQFEHVEWEGFRFYDLIFPLFMFLVGCVIPFSLEKFRGDPRSAYGRIFRRTVALFVLGLICNGLLKFDFGNLRYAGVLQRIALCYGITAVLFLTFRVRGQIVVAAAILLGYWGLLAFVPVPGGVAGDYSKEGNLAGYLDRSWLPGKIMEQYYGYGDNEGILSTVPAIVTVMLGVFAGLWLKSSRPDWAKTGGLLFCGVSFVVIGTLWGRNFPIIKNLWTSSFVLVAGGWSLLLLGLFYTLIDVVRWQKWSFFWTVIGMNAIVMYVAPRFIDFDRMAAFFLTGVARLSGSGGDFLLEAGSMGAKWLFLYYLYRNRVFLRL